MFPELREIPCESKKEYFELTNWIMEYFKVHMFMRVKAMYEHLELEPIPENANDYCWFSVNDFFLHKVEGRYFIATRDPIEIIGKKEEQ